MSRRSFSCVLSITRHTLCMGSPFCGLCHCNTAMEAVVCVHPAPSTQLPTALPCMHPTSVLPVAPSPEYKELRGLRRSQHTGPHQSRHLSAAQPGACMFCMDCTSYVAALQPPGHTPSHNCVLLSCAVFVFLVHTGWSIRSDNRKNG